MTATDGALVVGARCTEENCDWGPMGADDPNTWRLVEDFRREHEDETGHTTTVEVVRHRTIVEGRGLDGVTLGIAEERAVAIEWVCPECEQTAADLDAGRRCPNCDEPFREAFP